LESFRRGKARLAPAITTAQAVFLALIVFACFSYPMDYVEFQIVAMFSLAIISPRITRMDTARVWKGISIIAALALVWALFGIYNYRKIIGAADRAVRINFSADTDVLKKMYPKMNRNAVFCNIYGEILNHKELYGESIGVLENALRLNPNSQTLLVLGDSYQKTGDDASAKTAYQTAAFMKPSLFEPHYLLAKLYLQQGDTTRAREKANYLLNKKVKIPSPKLNRILKEMSELTIIIN
jgi:tetratricopeptide (TPR) repeat protein